MLYIGKQLSIRRSLYESFQPAVVVNRWAVDCEFFLNNSLVAGVRSGKISVDLGPRISNAVIRRSRAFILVWQLFSFLSSY